MNDDKAIAQLEKRHLKDERNNLYIAFEELEDVDFYWSEKEVKMFDKLWKRKEPISDIANALNRDEISVFLLSLDRIFQRKIKARDWRIW
jgi:hypothetical protein